MKQYLVLFTLLGATSAHAATQVYKLNSTASSKVPVGQCPVNSSSYYSSLEQIHSCLKQNTPVNSAVDIVISGSENKVANGSNSLLWTVSGSKNYPITISSASSSNKAAFAGRDFESKYEIVMTNVSYINIENLIFNNSVTTLLLNNVDNSSIVNSKFNGGEINGSGGGGNIWLGAQTSSGYRAGEFSENNVISGNTFSGVKVNNFCNLHKYQAIYLSYGSKGNNIYNNTFHIDQSGFAVGFNHGYQVNNTVRENTINKTYREYSSSSFTAGEACSANHNKNILSHNNLTKVVNSMRLYQKVMSNITYLVLLRCMYF